MHRLDRDSQARNIKGSPQKKYQKLSYVSPHIPLEFLKVSPERLPICTRMISAINNSSLYIPIRPKTLSEKQKTLKTKGSILQPPTIIFKRNQIVQPMLKKQHALNSSNNQQRPTPYVIQPAKKMNYFHQNYHGGALTADHFYYQPGKARPESIGNSQEKSILTHRKKKKTIYDHYYGLYEVSKKVNMVNKEILLDLGIKAKRTPFNPSDIASGENHRNLPKTSERKSRVSLDGHPIKLLRMATPQIVPEHRPESRYNKASLCGALESIRQFTPDYDVPIVRMCLFDNPAEHLILPSCWK